MAVTMVKSVYIEARLSKDDWQDERACKIQSQLEALIGGKCKLKMKTN